MLERRKLNDEELSAVLPTLENWTIKNGKLHKQFKFPTFASAMGWMMAVAIECDKLDHHPEWTNVYNRVSVDLTTHDMDNSISTWDIDIARKMDQLAK